MDFQLFNWLIPAEGETTVRTYHCTTLRSRLLSLKAEGFLVVTNKRVVFHGFGSSYSGNSVLQSEVPIEDVSGITCYSGGYFSILHLLGAFLATLFAGFLVNSIIVGGLLNAVQQSLYDNPFESLGSIENILFGTKILFWVLAIGCFVLSLRIKKDNIFRSILAGLAAMFLSLLGGLGFFSDMLGGGLLSMFGNTEGTASSIWTQLTMVIAVGVGIYALVCMFWYGRRTTMSLSVGSKGGSNTPIAISGVRSFGAAGRSLSAEPAEDSESLIKQLGAMITDIQALGDFGIGKWTSAN